MDEKLMTVKQVADKLSCSEEWVRQQCRKNKWPHMKLGSRYVFSWSDLMSHLNSGCSLKTEYVVSKPSVGKETLWQ